MLLPEGVIIDGTTGAVTPETRHYTKRLSELRGLFQDDHAFAEAMDREDAVVYEVAEYRKENSDIFFGTTTMYPGKVGKEYYFTRGHFHQRRDMGEVYYAQSGAGILLLESRDGRAEAVEMRPGVCAFIPPDWAHRTVNVGDDKFVFVWVCNPQAGHDYADIQRKGMRLAVIEQGGRPAVVDNSKYLSS